MIFLFFVLIIAVFVYLIYTNPVKLFLRLSSGEMEMKLNMSWLNFLRITAKTVDFRIHVTAHVFKARIYSGFIKKTGKSFNGDILKALSLDNTELKTYYGLNEPHMTGILFGALSFIVSMAGVQRFEQYPQFISEDEYLHIEGSSELNIGKTGTNYVRLKLRERKRRRNHGSISVKQ